MPSWMGASVGSRAVYGLVGLVDVTLNDVVHVFH